MTTSAVGVLGTQGTQAPPEGGGVRGLDIDQFLTLMITELQNQDPLNPLENDQILQQISQIREIEATSQLRETLDAVLLGQNLANAGSLIHQRVSGLASTGDEVTGTVDKVSVAGEQVVLHIGESQVELKNLRSIIPE